MTKTLYVYSGRHEIDLRALEDVFTTVGDVQSSRMEVISQLGNPRGFGVFEMANEQQATDCAERFNGQLIAGQVHSVVRSKPAATMTPTVPFKVAASGSKAKRKKKNVVR